MPLYFIITGAKYQERMMLMNNKKLIKSLINLVVLSFIGKFLSLLARLSMARAIKIEAMSYFSIINPLMVLLLNLSQFGLPLACSTLIAKHPNKTKKLFVSALLISISISLLLMALIYILAPYIANNLLNSKDATLATYGLGLLIPLVALSSMLKALYIGKGDVKATTYSTIAEESTRIIFIVFFISFFSNKGPEYGALGAVIGMAIGEVGQSLFLYLKAPKKAKKDCFYWLIANENDDPACAIELVKISLPITIARLIGSLTYCLEPVIYTNMLKGLLDTAEITRNYGVLTGYVMPLLLMPGFFATALSNYLLPKMSNFVENKNIKEAKNIFVKLTLFCLTLGFIFSIVLFFGSSLIMNILYGTTIGSQYIKILAFPFLIYYVEAPIITAMHAIGKTKSALRSTIISSIFRILVLVVFVKKLNIYAVALSTILSAGLDILLNLIDVTTFLKRQNV